MEMNKKIFNHSIFTDYLKSKFIDMISEVKLIKY
jgi:hypothetical protein